jgi:hypothetical protein
MSSAEGHGDFLTRSRLRDTVFVFSFGYALFFHVSNIETGIAFFLLSLGTFIHFVTKGVLIRNQVLCREGIYSIVRHPYYLANFLVDSCFCVIGGFHFVVLVYPFLFFWSYGPTMRKEERDLRGWYPESFREYALDTPQVFPDRRSIRNIGSFFAGFSVSRVSAKEMARIVRFYAMAALILFAHSLPLRDARGIDLPGHPVAVAFLSAASLLYVCSAVILKIGKNRAHREADTLF